MYRDEAGFFPAGDRRSSATDHHGRRSGLWVRAEDLQRDRLRRAAVARTLDSDGHEHAHHDSDFYHDGDPHSDSHGHYDADSDLYPHGDYDEHSD